MKPQLLRLSFLALAVAGGSEGLAAELRPGTLRAWEEYQRLTEARVEKELGSREFLVQDHLGPEDRQRCREILSAGGVYVHAIKTLSEEGKRIEVPDGLIHHWLGSIFVPGANLPDLLTWLQDYAQHEKYFKEVERSRLLLRDGDRFKIFFRLKRKKIVTVYYNSEHEVVYRPHGPERVSSRSYATRIAELDGPGTSRERQMPPGKDRGYLWRLNSYWRFLERAGGVVVECESVSLSRSIPSALRFIIRRFVDSVPRESLESTLLSVRNGYHARAKGQLARAPETILYNGKVVTVDKNFSYAEAVAIAGGKFTAVGKSQQVRKLAGASTRLINLEGRTVIPGLVDDHLHGAGGGPGVDLSKTRNLDDVLRAIGERAPKTPPGEVILTNSDWHEAQLKEQRLPLRRDLDRVAPNHPVVVVRGGHEYILNSTALKRWNIDKTTPEPPGGKISRYEDGELNGELVDRAKALVTLPPPPPKSLNERIQETVAEHRKLHAAGLTGIRYPGGPIEQYRMLEEVKRRGLLTMRVTQLLRPLGQESGGGDIRATVEGWKLGPEEGDEWLRIGGIKLGLDGGFEGGWMREPYAPPWDQNGKYRGIQTMPAEAYTAMVKELNRLGWRVFTHAVGDAAIDQVLGAYEAANAEKSIVGRRWGIEHGFIPQADQFPRMKELGLIISAQNHLYLAGPSLVKYWGPKRAAWTTPMRAYLDHGLPVAGGTDSSVIPYPPLWVIYHFVTRDTISGGVLGADQKITREEALRVSTQNNAYLTFEENVKGSIEPGKLADLVVLAEDIMTCPEKRIEQMAVLMTMVGGKTVYEHPDFSAATTR